MTGDRHQTNVMLGCAEIDSPAARRNGSRHMLLGTRTAPYAPRHARRTRPRRCDEPGIACPGGGMGRRPRRSTAPDRRRGDRPDAGEPPSATMRPADTTDRRRPPDGAGESRAAPVSTGPPAGPIAVSPAPQCERPAPERRNPRRARVSEVGLFQKVSAPFGA